MSSTARSREDFEMQRISKEEAARLLLQQDETIRNQAKLLAWHQRRVASLEAQVTEIARLLDVGSHIAKLQVTADENNPAQPWPEPGAEAPVATSDEALATGAHPVSNDQPAGGNNEGTADLFTPGATPVTNVAPATTTSVDSPGADLQTPAYSEDQDVTKPVDGTQGPRPVEEVKIEHDVRVDQGDWNPAFPTEGPFTQEVKTTSMASVQQRVMASIRLASLRVKAGITDEDPIELGDKIASSDLSTEVIEHEIRTLESVRTASHAAAPVRRDLVPRVAGVVASAQEAPVVIPSYEFASGVSGEEVGLFE